MTPPRRRPWVGDALVAVVLAAAAAALRAGPLGASSLWLDDAWAALVSRADGLGEARLVGPTVPGFAVLLWVWFGLVGFSETAAQALPFAAGVLGPPALWLVARRRGLSPAAALVGAGILLASPVHVEYSTRVKQYTLEALLVLGIVALGWLLTEEPRRRRPWIALGAASFGAVLVSASVAPVVAGAFAAAWVALLRDDRTGWRPAAVVTAASGLACGAWALVIVAPNVSADLRAYWAGSYLTSAGAVWPNVERVLKAVAPVPAWLSGSVLAVSFLVVAARRPRLAVLFGLPVVIAVGLAALELAPFGGGRTDTYLLPVLALVVAVAVGELLPVRRAWALPSLAVAVAVVAVLAALTPSPAYPAEDVGPLIADLERRAEPDDLVLVYSATRWAYGLYGSDPIELVAADRMPGFSVARPDGPVFVLGPWRDEPARYGPEIAAVTAGHDRVWFVASHWASDLPAIEAALRETGLVRREQIGRPGGLLELWTRA